MPTPHCEGAGHPVQHTPVLSGDRQDARNQVSDACLKKRVGLETDGIFVTLGFQELIEVRRGESRIASEVAPHLPIPTTGNHGFQNVVPAMGAMDVAGAQGTPFQIAELVEHEQ